MRILPTFKGYTIDCRLKELRFKDKTGHLCSMPFDYYGAEEILSEYIETLDQYSKEFKDISNVIL